MSENKIKCKPVIVKITIKDVEINLTPDELIDLKREIDKLIPEPIQQWYPIYPQYPQWTYNLNPTASAWTIKTGIYDDGEG